MVFRMQMQSLMFFFWGGDFHASVLSFLEPATSACSWHVKTHSSSKLIGTTSETIRNPAEPHRADNYWILLITGSWYFRMVHAAKANFVNFFRCYAPSQGPTQRKRRDMLCKAVSNPSMTHAQPDCPGLHGLPTIAKEITEGLTLDWTHGRNMKELIVLNEFQWYTMDDIRLVDIGCLICLLLLHANVQHLRAPKKLQLAKIPQLSVGFTCKSEQRQCQHLDRSLAWTRHVWI